MRRLYFIIAIIFLIHITCNENVKTNNSSKKFSDSINNYKFSPPSKLSSLSVDFRIRNDFFDWYELGVFVDGFEDLRTLNPKGALVFIEELQVKSNKLSNSVFPKKFDIPDIKSRLKVVQTMLMLCEYHSKKRDWKKLDSSFQKLYMSYNSFANRLISISEEADLFIDQD